MESEDEKAVSKGGWVEPPSGGTMPPYLPMPGEEVVRESDSIGHYPTPYGMGIIVEPTPIGDGTIFFAELTPWGRHWWDGWTFEVFRLATGQKRRRCCAYDPRGSGGARTLRKTTELAMDAVTHFARRFIADKKAGRDGRLGVFRTDGTLLGEVGTTWEDIFSCCRDGHTYENGCLLRIYEIENAEVR